jgi:hypothetical protein
VTAPRYRFDRGKPFYPLVMNYFCQLIGMKELIIRGVVGPRRIDEMLAIAVAREPRSEPELLRKQLGILIGPLQLRSERINGTIDAPIDEIVHDLIANHPVLLPHFISAAGAVLVLAHEISKHRPWHNQGPIWEFLRHCRNAVAHGGTLHFARTEPSRPAEWRSLVLTAELHGTPLHKKDGSGRGMLSPGDPILLLWDIEQMHPAMIAE